MRNNLKIVTFTFVLAVILVGTYYTARFKSLSNSRPSSRKLASSPFLPSRCPSPESLQSAFIKSNFNVSLMQNLYYELAFHDITQPRICQCQTSNKTLSVDHSVLYDDFRIQCSGRVYRSNLTFRLISDTTPFMYSKWNNFPLLGKLVQKIAFPNTIVDGEIVYDEKNRASFQWIIEFQCIDGSFLGLFHRIKFFAMNFYHQSFLNQTVNIQIMQARGRAAGLGSFIDHLRGMKIVNHTGCVENH